MQLNKKYLQTFVFFLVYLFAIYFWSQPYQERKLPYGEYDAMSHFEIGDYMSFTDKSLTDLPPYIDIRYGTDNKFRPHTLWYPPPFHTTFGIMQVIGGERIIPVYLMNTIMAAFILVAVYFVINRMFGFFPAILSSFLLIFSPRDFMPYLWGQWPERFAYAFVPIILYCFYRYFTEYSKESRKPLYLYLTSAFLGMNILVHPLVFFHSVFGISVLYFFLWIKQKKFVFNWKHILVSLLIFAVLFMAFPYQTFNVFSTTEARSDKGSAFNFNLGRIFQWSLNPDDYKGSVPPSYFSFREMNGLWTAPFLLAGLAFLLLRREKEDIFILAWLAGLYVVMHRDLFGKSVFLHRSLSATAHIFIPIAAIGAFYFPSLFSKLWKQAKMEKIGNYAKYVFVFVFIYFSISVNAVYAGNGSPAPMNKETYNSPLVTLTEPEYIAADWIMRNVPQQYNVSVLGVPHYDNYVSTTSRKIRWLGAASQNVTRFYYLLEEEQKPTYLRNNYVMLDYNLVLMLKDGNLFNDMKKFEETMLSNHTLVYNNNDIKIFKPKQK